MMPHKKTIEVLFSFVKINWTDFNFEKWNDSENWT